MNVQSILNYALQFNFKPKNYNMIGNKSRLFYLLE